MEPVSPLHFFLEGKHCFTADGSPGMNTSVRRVDNLWSRVETSQTDPVLHYLTHLAHHLVPPDKLPLRRSETAACCYWSSNNHAVLRVRLHCAVKHSTGVHLILETSTSSWRERVFSARVRLIKVTRSSKLMPVLLESHIMIFKCKPPDL